MGSLFSYMKNDFMISWMSIPYIISGVVCLLSSVMLLVIRPFPIALNITYQRIKSFLAYSALIDVFLDVLILILIVKNQDIFFLDKFVTPMTYCAQLYLMTQAILGLLYSNSTKILDLRLYFFPLFFVAILYVSGYFFFSNSHFSFSVDKYLEYNSTLWGSLFAISLYFLLFVEFIICLLYMYREIKRYLNRLNNCYSGEVAIKGLQINRIAFCFFGYFLLSAFDFLLSNKTLEPIFIIVNTILFVYCVVSVFNLQNTYLSVNLIDKTPVIDENTRKEDVVFDETKTNEVVQDKEIDKLIQSWENSDEKMFLKSNLIISDVADSLFISSIQLSFYLNHRLSMNFNTWINCLRIKEAKRLIKEDPQISFSRVSQLSGFADLAAFSKNFKKVTGVTPTEFRNSNKMA